MTTPVSDVLRTKGSVVHTIEPEATVFEAIKKMSDLHCASLIVLQDKGRLGGIVTERDGRDAVLADKNLHDLRVREVMTREIVTVAPDTPIEMCMELMTRKRVRHLPVLRSDQQLAGVISIGDLVKFLCDTREIEIDNLEKYITGSF